MALKLGMTVRRLEAEMPSLELTKWGAYFAQETAAARKAADEAQREIEKRYGKARRGKGPH